MWFVNYLLHCDVLFLKLNEYNRHLNRAVWCFHFELCNKSCRSYEGCFNIQKLEMSNLFFENTKHSTHPELFELSIGIKNKIYPTISIKN